MVFVVYSMKNDTSVERRGEVTGGARSTRVRH